MKNKLLSNSLTISLVVIATVLVFGYMIPLIYISAWALITGNYVQSNKNLLIFMLLFLSILLLPMLRGLKHIIINIGCEPSERPTTNKGVDRTKESNSSLQSLFT